MRSYRTLQSLASTPHEPPYYFRLTTTRKGCVGFLGFLTPILITVGELDFRVPMNNALMNFATQQRLNVPSKLLVFPEAGHWILRGEDSRYWYGEVHAWLAKYLK